MNNPPPDIVLQFNGIQKDADGKPALSIWTLHDPGHPAHGATTACPLNPTLGDIAQAVQTLTERFTP